jgi:Zn-dependent peptidase ImmA (M78 family)/transcriptional regulator with XRE-family HTH domain
MPPRMKAPINNKILEWFIADYNISIEEVAKKTGSTSAKVQSWINGSDSPTYKQAENLAYKVFKKPLAIFFMAELPTVLSVKKKFRSLPDYLFDTTSYKTRLAINKADFYKLALAELYKKNPAAELIFKTIKATTQSNVADLAKKIRELMGIDLAQQKGFKDKYKAFNFYRSALERNGIFTFQLQLEGDRAFCLLDDEYPVIILNSGDSPYSKIFSLFHELAHILIENEDIYLEEDLPMYTNDPQEVFCNKVAAEVLVPIAEFVITYAKNVNVLDESIIKSIASDYCVSREVILRRFLAIGKTTSSIYTDYKKKWDTSFAKGNSGGGDYYRSKVSALGKTYVHKVIDGFRNGFLNDRQITNFLDIKYAQLPRIEAEVYA